MELLVAAAAFGDQFTSYVQELLGIDATIIVNILRIVGIDIVLAGDNAVVIGLAAAGLPANQRARAILIGIIAVAVIGAITLIGTWMGDKWNILQTDLERIKDQLSRIMKECADLGIEIRRRS